jgi:hypothetical protein
VELVAVEFVGHAVSQGISSRSAGVLDAGSFMGWSAVVAAFALDHVVVVTAIARVDNGVENTRAPGDLFPGELLNPTAH